jgi:thiol:disulfide interchange protein/DsbC/DsbD-like thiol-disulfide interchange protein
MPTFRSPVLPALIGAFLAAGFLRASDAIPVPSGNRSATVTQTHVTAELLAETPKAAHGDFDVALHLHMDPDWHTYWINPGEAGLATTIKWTLPPGWTAGPIEWPTPEVHDMGGVTTYGYGGDVYLLTTITPPYDISGHFPEKIDLKAKVDWLVCKEECIPGRADLALTVATMALGKSATPDPASAAFFTAARARLPVKNTRWNVTAAYQGVGLSSSPGPNALIVRLKEKKPGQSQLVANAVFYPEQPNVIAGKNQLNPPVSTASGNTDLLESLEQNGDKPAKLSGVVVSDVPLIGEAKAVYLESFPTNDHSISIPSASLTPAPSGSFTASTASSPNVAAPPSSGATSGTSPAAPASAPFLPAILAFAFLGGLILNLMPCVLPVLSLKVFSLIRHAGDHAGGAWKQGVAFTAGVLISFWILAGLLIALESAGSHLGWGFQMQSPGFVLALIFLFFLLGLNLFGVFEFGASLVGVDAKASSNLTGLPSSFANGALATLAATPCTAPFMGSAVGFAAQQPATISLLVFTFLALGMAAPYLALTTFPGALKLIPKPGRWMEMLRQFMGFLLLGTVIFLVYVFGALTGSDSVPMLLGALLVAALAAWIFGRGTAPIHGAATRFAATLAALLLLAASIAEGARLTFDKPARSSATAQDGWQVYSPAGVQQALAQGHPAFVDFTAAWCLSCKVNEHVALDIDSTRKVFSQKQVALFRGDWTHSDPQISDTLRQFNRNGVPLYLVYSPKNPDAPQVLPEVLTPGIVQNALQKLP